MKKNYSLLQQNDALLVLVHEDLGDSQARALRTDVGTWVVEHDVIGVILDISAVEFVDSFMARMLDDVFRVARLYGYRAVLAGIRPAVALTLTELGISFNRAQTARDAQSAYLLLGHHAAASHSNRAMD